MAQFNYEEYIKEVQERTIDSQINCREWRDDNYTQYILDLPNRITIIFNENKDGTKEILYFENNKNNIWYKEVALIEHEPGKYHVKVIDQTNSNIKIFGTHLDYDSDEDDKEDEE